MQKLAAGIEPGAATPSRRFAAVGELTDAGLFSGIVMTPILPFLEDTEENVTGMVDRAKESGARGYRPAYDHKERKE